MNHPVQTSFAPLPRRSFSEGGPCRAEASAKSPAALRRATSSPDRGRPRPQQRPNSADARTHSSSSRPLVASCGLQARGTEDPGHETNGFAAPAPIPPLCPCRAEASAKASALCAPLRFFATILVSLFAYLAYFVVQFPPNQSPPRKLESCCRARNNLPMQASGDSSQQGLLSSLIGDGRPLLSLVAVCLMLSGWFALFLSATGHFLPHDVRFLGMDKDQLCGINQCRIVHFMFHDRVSFGGALIAIGWLYLWLIQFPLRAREPWAWWVFVITGVTGFGSFLAYLGYGYLDSWHGVATLFLLPVHLLGLIVSWRHINRPKSIRSLLQRGFEGFNLGRALLLGTAIGLILGGGTICIVGMTSVFVPQDLQYIGMTSQALGAINPRLVPLIAHDRAGFGGGIATTGVIMFFCVWCGQPMRSLW